MSPCKKTTRNGFGWMVNADLFPGNTSFHGLETIGFVNQSLGLADRMTVATRLLVMDCGLADQEMLASLHDRPNTDLILKHSRRRESSTKWLELAKEKSVLIRKDNENGFRVYCARTHRCFKDGELGLPAHGHAGAQHVPGHIAGHVHEKGFSV